MKKSVLIVIGLLPIVFLSGCIGQPPTFSECENATNSTERDLCYSDEAFYTRTPGYCEQIRDQYIKDDCYFALGLNMHRRSLCNRISDEIMRDDCLAGI